MIVPKLWLQQLSPAMLAATLARRIVAIESGLRTRGLLVAFAWTVLGFYLASLLPGGGVRSVAQLVTTFCGFTCWSFLGLLILPTVSRQAAYAIDEQVLRRGVPDSLLLEALSEIDRNQDDEPQRPAAIETIFHPVPSVNNRRSGARGVSGAWHAARMSLFLSWACVGLLSRAVHCNSGRPELWVLLPTD